MQIKVQITGKWLRLFEGLVIAFFWGEGGGVCYIHLLFMVDQPFLGNNQNRAVPIYMC